MSVDCLSSTQTAYRAGKPLELALPPRRPISPQSAWDMGRVVAAHCAGGSFAAGVGVRVVGLAAVPFAAEAEAEAGVAAVTWA